MRSDAAALILLLSLYENIVSIMIGLMLLNDIFKLDGGYIIAYWVFYFIVHNILFYFQLYGWVIIF